MAAGCIPVVGYNVGAGRNDRVKALFIRLLIGEFTAGAVALLIVEFFPRQLSGPAAMAAQETKAAKAAGTGTRVFHFSCVHSRIGEKSLCLDGKSGKRRAGARGAGEAGAFERL